MKKKTNLSAKGIFVLFSLLASSLLGAPDYTACQNIFPDEYMDLSAIFESSQKQSPVSRVAALTPTPFSLNYSWSYYLILSLFSPQSIPAQNALATLMRC